MSQIAKPTGDQYEELFRQIGAGRIHRGNMQKFLENPDRTSQAAATVAAPTPEITPTVAPGFKLRVSYSLTLMQMIRAGAYNYASTSVTTKNFPHDSALGVVEIDAECIYVGRKISTEDVFAEIDRRGLRPATMQELLAFGAAFPEEQRKFPIVALGSFWTRRSGSRYVGILGRDGSERDLSLSSVEDGWHGCYRFLAVRK